MKTYIGTKIVQAEPMNRLEFNALKGVVIPKNDAHAGDKGYKVIYPDGYESWSPKDVFEKAYYHFHCENNTVTQQDVDDFIAKVDAQKIGEKTTVVHVTLVNGFTLVEASSCVDPKTFDMAIGTEICMEKIKDKIWFLIGFLLQTANGYERR